MVGVLEEMTEEMKTEEKTGRLRRLSCRQVLLDLLRQLRSGQLSTTVDLGMDSRMNLIRLEMQILDKVDRRLLDLVRRMLQALIRLPIQDMDLRILAVDPLLGCRWRQEEEEALVDHHLVDRRFQALGHSRSWLWTRLRRTAATWTTARTCRTWRTRWTCRAKRA